MISLTAPIAGKVVTNNAVLGGMVDESTEVLTILDPTHLWVEADIYEKDIARIRTGQRVRITVPAYPQEVFPGAITYVSDLLNPETRTITVRSEVSNEGLELKPGMFANLVIELNHSGTALSVPTASVLDDQGHALVFVRLASNRFEPRLVTVGMRENGFVEISDGIREGEVVVSRGNFQLKSKLYEEVLSSAHVH
jgi:cobalt-zinc-cadmium efflux system membrane fusion protein